MKRLSSLIMALEVSAGTPILDAANDLCQLATQLGIRCEARFNGILLIARPGDNPARIVDRYRHQKIN